MKSTEWYRQENVTSATGRFANIDASVTLLPRLHPVSRSRPSLAVQPPGKPYNPRP